MGTNRHVVAALAVAGLLAGCAAGCADGSSASGSPGAGASSVSSSGATGAGPAASGSSASGASGSSAGAASGATGTAAGTQAAGCAAASPAAASAASGESGSSGSSGSPALQSVQFTDPAHGWVAGAGRILATSDGGRSWTRQYSGSAALDQVDFTDDAHGWAVGQGVLLRSVNGGAGWTALSEPRLGGNCLVVGSVHFLSPALGYAVAVPRTGAAVSAGTGSADTGSAGNGTGSTLSGTPGVPAPAGRLLRTTDGGTTWSAVPAAPSGAQSACFGSARDGYVGVSGRIWRTTDAGETWTLAFTEPAASPAGQPASTASAASGTSQSAGAKSGQFAGDTPELQCAGQDAAWVLFLGSGVAMMHAPYLAYATEQGSSWHGVLEEPMLESAIRPTLHLPGGPGSEPGPFSVISPGSAAFIGYTPPAKGYGAAPVDLVTGGTTVKSAGDVGAVNEPLGAAFLTPAQGWVVGENLKTSTFEIEATSDGGRSWTTQYTAS